MFARQLRDNTPLQQLRGVFSVLRGPYRDFRRETVILRVVGGDENGSLKSQASDPRKNGARHQDLLID
jgi:hypothetical protein